MCKQMECYYYRVLFSLSVIIVVAVNAQTRLGYRIPQPTASVLSPRGFRISIPDERGIILFAFHGSINKEIRTSEIGDFHGETRIKSNGVWSYENTRHQLQRGDILYFWIYVQHDNFGYKLENQQYTYPDHFVYNTNYGSGTNDDTTNYGGSSYDDTQNYGGTSDDTVNYNSGTSWNQEYTTLRTTTSPYLVFEDMLTQSQYQTTIRTPRPTTRPTIRPTIRPTRSTTTARTTVRESSGNYWPGTTQRTPQGSVQQRPQQGSTQQRPQQGSTQTSHTQQTQRPSQTFGSNQQNQQNQQNVETPEYFQYTHQGAAQTQRPTQFGTNHQSQTDNGQYSQQGNSQTQRPTQFGSNQQSQTDNVQYSQQSGTQTQRPVQFGSNQQTQPNNFQYNQQGGSQTQRPSQFGTNLQSQTDNGQYSQQGNAQTQRPTQFGSNQQSQPDNVQYTQQSSSQTQRPPQFTLNHQTDNDPYTQNGNSQTSHQGTGHQTQQNNFHTSQGNQGNQGDQGSQFSQQNNQFSQQNNQGNQFSQQSGNTNNPNLNCYPSITTVNKKRINCKDTVIFEEQFDYNFQNRWSQDIRMPLEFEDAEFVAYENFPSVWNISYGNLNIYPKLLYHIPESGFNENDIRTGRFVIDSRECTSFVDPKQECERQAGLKRILPPIVSAKFRSKKTFSFKFGRVDIRAKLPKGDWMFPQIHLEPSDNKYRGTGDLAYLNGQVRIAFVRGNEYLEKSDGIPLDGKILVGICVVSSGDRYGEASRKSIHYGQYHFGNDFHTYSLIWTNSSIRFLVDDVEYGTDTGGYKNLPSPYKSYWQSGTIMAPFDQEFHIALGVGVGGNADFADDSRTGYSKVPKPWENTSPKAELNFYLHAHEWYPTWNNHDSGMIIDYVKVTSV